MSFILPLDHVYIAQTLLALITVLALRIVSFELISLDPGSLAKLTLGHLEDAHCLVVLQLLADHFNSTLRVA